MISLESNIRYLIGQLTGDPCNQVEVSFLRQSELDRNTILLSEEELWHIRSRALWLSSGDNNTKYFHKIANHNRIRKHIWEFFLGYGVLVNKKEALLNEETNYFKDIYKAPSTLNTSDQCKVTYLFPQMLDEEESSCLFA